MKNNKIEVIYTNTQLLTRIKELSVDLNEYYKNKPSVLVVPVLDGAIVFAGQLIPMLDFDLTVRATKISSYLNKRTSNTDPKIHILIDMSLVKDQTILIIEDLIDQGHTLWMFKDYLMKMGAKEVKICVLFNKQIPEVKNRKIVPDWNGFMIADEWVAGFGIDSESKYRNFPHFGKVIK